MMAGGNEMHTKTRTLAAIAIVAILLMASPTTMAAPGGGKGGGGGGPGDGGGVTYPAVMAGMGDSITQAMDSDSLGDKPWHSWSYGYENNDGIDSHLERIDKANKRDGITGHFNAESGAKMVHLAAQAQESVNEGVEYATILMGANDVCTSSPSTMTSVTTFEAQFRDAVNILTSQAPNMKVYVISIPDVYQLWDIYHTSGSAQFYWGFFNICQSLLDTSRTEADRQFVRQRNSDFNDVLANVVAEQQAAGFDWHWDGYATWNFQFARAHVSTVDYFHPSNFGQGALADTTWNAGPYA